MEEAKPVSGYFELGDERLLGLQRYYARVTGGIAVRSPDR